MTETLDAALRYAARRLPVLPLQPAGKAPAGRLVPHGHHDATTDAATIRRWWTALPDANVGIRTGDGLAVLDIDGPQGDQALSVMAANHDLRLPDAPTVHTGRGRHLYLAAPRGTRTRHPAPGLDLKADGGHVVAPPSLHPSGRQYTWDPARTLDTTPVPDAPRILLGDPADMPDTGRTPDQWAHIARNGAPVGQRNTTAAALAGRYFARGLDPYEVLGLLEAWDATRNRPPLGHREIAHIVKSIARAHTRARRKARP